VPTGKRPTEEIVDCIGKVTLVPNLSCLFSVGTLCITLNLKSFGEVREG